MGPKKTSNCTEKFVIDTVEELKASLLDAISIEIKKSIDALKSSIIDSLVKDNKILSKKVKTLENEIDHLHDRVYDMEVGLIDQQQRSRRNNLEITGIPNDVLDTNLEKTVINLFNRNLEDDDELDEKEIDAIHRLPAKEGKVKPVVMRLVSRKRRDQLLKSGRELTNMNLSFLGIKADDDKIYVNEHFSPDIKTFSYFCRKLRREHKIFKFNTENGQIKIKLKENDKWWKKIKHEQDLVNIFPKYNFY